MKKGMKIVRFIGIVCWFLALFILINGHQEKKKRQRRRQNSLPL